MKTMTWIAGMLLATANSALAQGPTTVVGERPSTERVGYQPSELANAAGIRDLRRQVRSAAHRGCAPSPDTFPPTYSELRCFRPTLTEALAQVDQAVARWTRGELPSAPPIVVAAR